MSVKVLHLAAILFLASNVGFCVAECNGVASACSSADTLSDIYPLKTCYENKENITYTCKGTLHGPPENICNNGKWMFPTPDCEVFTCDIPTVDSSVILTPRKSIYDAREEVLFECAEGFILEGPLKASCEGSHSWNPSTIPICLKLCQPPTIDHGYALIESPMKMGDTTSVVCDVGYEIHVGQSHRITCGNDGNWEHLPECVKE